MNIGELLRKELNIDEKNICVNISTIIADYNMCFIEYEDEEKLGVYITGNDGRERYLIINKESIVSLQVVYRDDIKLGDKDSFDIMVG